MQNNSQLQINAAGSSLSSTFSTGNVQKPINFQNLHLSNPLPDNTSHLDVELNFLTPKQAIRLLQMFDSKEAYSKNFPALKAITLGLYKLMKDDQSNIDLKVSKMFQAVNSLQGILILDNPLESVDIIKNNPL